MSAPDYVELHAHSAFSLLDGASPPEALVARAAELGMPALALTDHQGLYGAVKFRNACQNHSIRPIYGAEIEVKNAGHLTLLVESATGWASLCRLLSSAGLAGTKHERPVTWAQLEAHNEGLICLTGCRGGVVATPARNGDRETTLATARRLARLFGPKHCYVELQRHYDTGDRRLNATLVALAEHVGLEVVATNNVHYARPDGHRLQHVLTCIRARTTLDEAGSRLYATPHRYLKSPREMAALFADLPQALEATVRIAERCRLALDHTDARLPAFPVPDGETAFSHLLALCYAGLRRRYDPVSSAAAEQLTRELAVIEREGLADYFLMVHDIVRFAREAGIPCQGRGSAAGSITAYALGITPVDPLANGLLFERFLAEGSTAVPDIDVDFAADRREEVLQYVYERYGNDRTAMVANVVTFRARSAVADVGKVLGFPADLLAEIRQHLYTRSANDLAPDLAAVEQFSDRLTHLPWQRLLELCAAIDGLPRHLSIHSGGMIVTARPLAELVPLERATMPGRVVVQWDKDDVADAGLIKIDLLSLRTLTLVREAFDEIAAAGGQALTIDSVPDDDPAVWQMLGAADTVGCFQVESRAQMNLMPRLRPQAMEDLIVAVSLIRPGPIAGGMSRHYLARRDGEEPVSYWHPSLAPVLEETLGVLVYQEQVLRVAMTLAGFSGAQADGLRRAMSRKRSREAMERLRSDFVAGAAARGVERATADHVFDHLLGFAAYGFCKSHAAAFALLSYVTAWLKCHHPAPFYCALLNAGPMGFYSTEVVIEDAKRHGIDPRPLDINRSGVRWTIEDGHLRVPLTRLRGLGAPLAERVVAARADGPFAGMWDFLKRVRPPRVVAERLVRAGALDFCGPDRRQLLWELGELHWSEGEMDMPADDITSAELPTTGLTDRVAADYELLGLAQEAHLLALLRPALAERGVATSLELQSVPDGQRARVAGRLEVVQRPPPAKGIAFVTLEDEHGLANLLLYPAVYERYRGVLRASPVILAEGVVQHERGTLHLLADRLAPVTVTDNGVAPEVVPGPAKAYA